MSSPQTEMNTANRVQTYKKRRDSTLAEKVKILELLQQPKASQSSVARNMGLSQSTISRVMKKREEILERWNQNENPSRKRNRPFKHAKVDEALLEWLLFAKANKLPISGPILMRQAEAIAKEIGCPQFKPSNGWLWRWKERYRLFYRAEVLPGERLFGGIGEGEYVKILPKASQTVRLELNGGAVTGSHYDPNGLIQGERSDHMMSMLRSHVAQVDVFSRAALLARIANDYPLQDIFCAVESPFHFRILAAKQGANAAPKETVGIWFCCNIDGTERLKLTVTHNLPSLGSHCLSPVSLKASHDGRLTDHLLIEWLLNWDAKLDRQERKVLLAFAANNTAPEVKLRNISLCIFSKEHVSSNHHFGEELVNEFGTLYRELLLERLEDETASDATAGRGSEAALLQRMSEISLVEATYSMNKAWLRVTPPTIKSCFQKQEVVRILCSATRDPSEAKSRQELSFPILQESNGNAANYTALTTGLVSCRALAIKEEEEEQSLGLRTSHKKPSYPNPELNAKEDPAPYSALESYPKLPAGPEEISTIVVKSEDPRERANVAEVREACDIIRQFLCRENQDMSIFCALQSQIERCLTDPTGDQIMM